MLRTIKTQRHKYWSILLHIAHGRSREITSELNEDVKGTLARIIEPEKMVPLKVLPKNIIWILRKINPPKVLMDERMLLEKLGIQCTHIKLMNIRKGEEWKQLLMLLEVLHSTTIYHRFP
ncbi:MAG: hypothetical protein ACTSXW_05160 [Candidatus Baldrarchaeia archaeon]